MKKEKKKKNHMRIIQDQHPVNRFGKPLIFCFAKVGMEIFKL